MTAKDSWNLHPTRGSGGGDSVWASVKGPVRGVLSPDFRILDSKSVACHVLCSLQLDQIGSMSPVPTPETNNCSVMKLANGPEGLVA